MAQAIVVLVLVCRLGDAVSHLQIKGKCDRRKGDSDKE